MHCTDEALLGRNSCLLQLHFWQLLFEVVNFAYKHDYMPLAVDVSLSMIRITLALNLTIVVNNIDINCVHNEESWAKYAGGV
jgi:hypothetical protein